MPTHDEGFGLAVCDASYHGVIVDQPRVIKPATPGGETKHVPSPPRDIFGRRHSHETAADLIRRVLGRAQRLPEVVGISYHDADQVDAVEGLDTKLVHISPTVATLAGLKLWHDPNQMIIQPGRDRALGGPTALIKIGPRRLTWAVDGDPTAPPHQIPASIVAGLNERAAAVFDFIGLPNNTDPVELLGNRGWRNTAAYFAEENTASMPRPNELTARLLRDLPQDRPGARTFTSHLGMGAMGSDPFALQVARHMTELIGLVVGYVAQYDNFGRIYVQCNSVTAITGMPEWVVRSPKSGLMPGIKYEGGSAAEIMLIGPRPQILEAHGASQLASRLVAA